MVTQPLRTLIVEPARDGHWHYTTSMARALAQRGVDVRMAAVFPYEVLEGAEEIPVSIVGRRRDGAPNRPWYAYRRLLEHSEKILGLLRIIREFHPTVVHMHGILGSLDFVYFRLIRLLGARVVYTAHDLSPSYRFDVFNRLRYRAADLMVVHSSNSVDRLRDYGVEKSKIVEIPHASLFPIARDVALPREVAKASLALPPGARVVLFFGRIEPRKGLDLLIDAHADLCREHSSVYLIIAGKPSKGFATHRERIAEDGLSGRVILDLRYVPFERMRTYFSAADVVALPYRTIYQSHVLQWAYAFGRPVVVTDVGGLREAVAADGTGLIVGEEDRGELARAILTLLSDESLARAMGDRALHLTRTKYSWEAVSEMLEGSYRSLLAGDSDTRMAAVHSVKGSAQEIERLREMPTGDPTQR